MESLTLRPEQAAKLLGLGRDAIYELVRSGELPSLKNGRRYLIPRAELEQWLQRKVAEQSGGVA